MTMRPKAARSAPPSRAGGPSSGQPKPQMRSREVAEFIADLVLELSRMARSAGLATVMIPLEFAYYEAFAAAHRAEIPPDELRYLQRLEEACRAALETGGPPDDDPPDTSE